MSDSIPARPRRRGRRLLKIAVIAVVLLLALVALAPTLISLGLGQGYIRSAIASNVKGNVSIGSISIGWFSGQRVEGLRIVDDRGQEVANLSVAVNNSLLSLVTGSAGKSKPIDVTVSGSVAGQLREDGSISFSDLLDSDAARVRRSRPPSNKPKKPLRDSIPQAVITVAGLNVTLDDPSHQQSRKIDNLTGRIAYVDPAQPITLDLHGKTATSVNGKTEAGTIDITGQADELFAADGALTLRGASTTADVKLTGIPLPVALQGKPATLQAMTLHVASDDITERLAITLSGDGQIEGAAKPTHFTVDGSIGKIVDGHGKLSLRAATAHLTAEATNIPVDSPPPHDVHGEMSTLTASIVSDDLTQKVEIAAEGAGQISGVQASGASADGQQPITLHATLALAEPFTPGGEFKFALAKLSGSASGKNVPTSLAQPVLAGLGVDAQRDLGPTLNLDASFPGGIGGDLTLEARSAGAQTQVIAKINDDQSVTGSKLTLDLPSAGPALIAALTKNGVFSDRPLNVKVDLSSFHLPPPDAMTKLMPLTQFAATGKLTLTGPANVRPGASEISPAPATTAPAAPALLPLDRMELNFETPALEQFLIVTGTATLGGGSIVIDQRISHLFNDQGALAIGDARPEGTLKVDNLPVETILAFAPPQHADLIRQIVGKAMSAQVAMKSSDAGLQTELTAHSDAATATLSMLGRNDAAHSVQLDKTIIDATVTPELAAIAQKNSTNPVVLGGPARVHLDLKPVLLPMGASADILSTPVSGHVTITDALLAKAPGLAEMLAIPALATDLTLIRKGELITATLANGSATLKRGKAKQDVAQMAMDGTIALDMAAGADAVKPNLNVQLTDLNTRQAETLLGLAPGTVANWTGDRGALDLHVESVPGGGGYTARATPAMPNLQGTFTASIKGDMVAITAEASRVVLNKDAVQARLNPAPPAPAAAPGTPATPPQRGAPGASASKGSAAEAALITVEADVPLQLAIKRCEFPLTMLKGAAFDAAAVNIDLNLTGGPLKTVSDTGIQSALSDLNLSLKVADISKGVQFALTSRSEAFIPAEQLEKLNAPEPAPAPRATNNDPPLTMQDAPPPPNDPRTAEERRQARQQERRNERNPASQPAQAPASQPVIRRPPVTQPKPGRLDVTGVLANVINSEGLLDLAHGRLQMDAKADNVPTSVADALADMQGLLVAAVGPQMNATFVADDFSVNSGTLQADIKTTNGSLSAVLRGRENSLRVNQNAPVKAELYATSELRERLLMKIHPILADVRSMEHPLRIDIPSALAAIPADVSKLRAELTIDVGKVQFDSGSTSLQILSLFGARDAATIPGEIEPIVAKIRNGIVTYDKFAVHIDKYTLSYSGQIDLEKQEVNIRTEIPLSALKQDIPQVRGYADKIVVPLVTRGKFGALKTSIDPDFDFAKAALNAGVSGAVGGDIGSLLDQILNKDKEPDAIANPPKRRDRLTTRPQQ